LRKQELVSVEGLGYGVVVTDNGNFILVSFAQTPDLIGLERDEVEHIGWIDPEDDEEYDETAF